MNLKKLTQAVFEGLPPEYLWAAVDANGKAWAFIKKPVCDDLMFCDGDDAKSENVGVFFDATDWQNSLIERLSDTCIDDMGIANAQKQSERQDAPTAADIDWSKAPEGATHYNTYSKQWFFAFEGGRIMLFCGDAWSIVHDYTVFDLESAAETIKRPESITDVARSIEAARVTEQSERTYPHYFKDVSAVDAIDLYHVARLYDITDPALFHAFKKIACAGKRGAKDQAQDVQEAIDALKRWQELNV